jgi:hypothetical protein
MCGGPTEYHFGFDFQGRHRTCLLNGACRGASGLSPAREFPACVHVHPGACLGIMIPPDVPPACRRPRVRTASRGRVKVVAIKSAQLPGVGPGRGHTRRPRRAIGEHPGAGAPAAGRTVPVTAAACAAARWSANFNEESARLGTGPPATAPRNLR